MRRPILAVGLFAIVAFASAASAQDSLWLVMAESGLKAYDKQEYKDALSLLKKAVAEIDKDRVQTAQTVIIRKYYGLTYRHLSRFAESEDALVAACKDARDVLAPENPEALLAAYELAVTRIRRGQDAKARPYMEWLVERVKDDADAKKVLRLHVVLDELASLYIRAKEYDKAEKAYAAAGEYEGTLEPDAFRDGNRLWNMALLQQKKEQQKAAARLFVKAGDKYASNTDEKLANNRDDVLSFTQAGRAYELAKEKDLATDAFDRVENRLSDTRLYWEQKKGETCREAVDARIHLADFQEERKRFADAEATLKKLHKLMVDKKGSGSEEATAEEMRVAAFHQRRENPAEAEKWFRSALDNREKKVGADSPDLAACLNRLAGFLSDNGKHEEAEKLLRRNLANCRAGGESAKRATAQALEKLAQHLHHHAAEKECFALLKEALGIYEKLDGASSRKVADVLDNMAWKADEKEVKLPLARRAKAIVEASGFRDDRYKQAVNTLGMACNGSGQHADAETCYRECLALELDRNPDRPTSAHLHNNVAVALDYRDLFKGGETEYLIAIDRAKEQDADKYSYAKYHGNLAGLYFNWHKPAEAEKFARKAFEIRDADSGKESTVLAVSLSQLAALEARKGEFAVAEGMLDRGAKIRERYFRDQEHQAKIANLFEAAWRHRHHGRFDAAEKCLADLFQLAEKFHIDESFDGIFSAICGPYWCYMFDAWELRGRVALDRGDFATADEHLRKALDAHEKYHPQTSRYTSVLLLLARCDAGRGEFAAATERAEKALGVVEKVFGEGHPGTANALQLLAELDLMQGKASADRFKTVLAIREKDPTAKPDLLWAKVQLARADKADAKALAGLLAEFDQMYGEAHYRRHELLAARGEALVAGGDRTAALADWKQVLAIREKTFGKDHKLTKAAQQAVQDLGKK